MAATIVIPARYGSTRFPAKILASQTGRPLVQHVVDQCRQCELVREVIVATDDQRIVDALRPYNTRCVMTADRHPSGTDRVAEVALELNDDIIVNVQGDEPEIEPAVVDGLIRRMEDHDDDMATACTSFKSLDDVRDPNRVKVISNLSGHAMYFSRSIVPFDRDDMVARTHGPGAWKLHVGVYAYRRLFLLQFAAWTPTPLEQAEKLEQLRALEHGKRIYVMPVAHATNGIDTPQQYEEFLRRVHSR